MRARFIDLHYQTKAKLCRLRKAAEIEGAYRVAKRIHAVLLNSEEYTSGTISRLLAAPLSKVSEWLRNYEMYGYEGLLEGYRCGRPPELSEKQLIQLADIIDSGPVAYGYLSGIWTSIMLTRVIEEEFGCHYHPGHVRKLLHQIGFSVQRPRKKLARGSPTEQDKWHRYTYPNLKKKVIEEGAALIYEDEASFRQDSTLHQTWARVAKQPEFPVTGERKSVKIFGAVNLYTAFFQYHRAAVFNAETYLDFLEQIARRYYPQRIHFIQDNASYHNNARVGEWFEANRSWFEVHPLPKYSPDLNAMERIWHHTRVEGTHNKYFVSISELVWTLKKVFGGIQNHPNQIRGYLHPFC